MKPYENVRPDYVKSWFNARRKKFKGYVEGKLEEYKQDKNFESTWEDIQTKYKQIKEKNPDRRYFSKEKEAEYDAMLAKEAHRDKIKSLIQLDDHYEENVPFADYSEEEEEDPNADMKGMALTMYGGWKQQRKPVKDFDVLRQEAKFQTQSNMRNFNQLYTEGAGYRARAKKYIDKKAERSNKLI